MNLLDRQLYQSPISHHPALHAVHLNIAVSQHRIREFLKEASTQFSTKARQSHLTQSTLVSFEKPLAPDSSQ